MSYINKCLMGLAIAVGFGCKETALSSLKISSPLALDQEQQLSPQKALNSGTQSINRYKSMLRDFSNINLEYLPSSKTLELSLEKPSSQEKVDFHQIDLDYLVPLLPYTHASLLDDFDKANLLLAEFARNGINLSYQETNDHYGYFNATDSLFNHDGEYLFDGTQILPNPGVRPKRMSVVNNCLQAGLWEINASDAVGEMYHGWFSIPEEKYFELLQQHHELENSAQELQAFFQANALDGIPVHLDRLRQRKKLLLESTAQVAVSKRLGGYSSQDSRRKVQRGFYKIMREGTEFQCDSFGQLQISDTFQLYSFIPPGIYNQETPFRIPYDPHWSKVALYEVAPLTTYGHDHSQFSDQGYLEIVLHHAERPEALIVGNVPIQLLVYSEDYKIPAFGAGVLTSSERIERRHLRLQQGPAPYYAYLVQDPDQPHPKLINNHHRGYEQIYLRPFQRQQQHFLRFTLVSYERIVDLMEFEIPLKGDLISRIQEANQAYQPPLYEVYTDDNTL